MVRLDRVLQADPSRDILTRYRKVQGCIADKSEGRAVTLIAVSKSFPLASARPLLAAGHRHFGENRLQEAQAKWQEQKERSPEIVLHALGPLQSNKIRATVALFDCLHTLDRPRTARRLAEEMSRTSRRLPCFVQVNLGEEPQKSGVLPDAVEGLLKVCLEECDLPICGLMCLPPLAAPSAPYFTMLRALASRHALPALSMGMSADYREAIALGATHVRIGSGIFGERAVARAQ